MSYYIGQTFTDSYPPQSAIWCNKNNAYIEKNGNTYTIVAVPEPTLEEIAEQELQQKKSERAEAVSRITVEVDGMVFDGDKTAQQNMSEAVITAMSIGVKKYNEERKSQYEAGELIDGSPITYDQLTTPWVLADNTVAIVTVGQIERALGLAKEALTPLWIKPYQ